MKEKYEETNLYKIRHSAAHIMAEAVISIFPTAKVAIGPAIEEGFYYDFELPRPLNPEDLKVIEEKMRDILKDKNPFIREEISREKALELFKDQPYKLELIRELPEGEVISTYTTGKFRDLCRGPHVEDSGKINPNALFLLRTAGAYWRGDEERPMLQRIYGTAWNNPKELREYQKKLEEIKKRDHRKLGQELELFSFHEQAGPGLVYWHPKGARMRHEIESFWKEQHISSGYDLIYTPHLGRSWLWEKSGHLGFYKASMYSPMDIDQEEYYIKPMNCPFHIQVYNNTRRSYRELPLKWAELGTVYRYERSGVLHGLLRVRGFTQDDAHIFCTPQQIDDEILEVLRFSLKMLKTFGFTEIKPYLSTKPNKAVGSEERWEQATESLKKAMEKEGLEYDIDDGGGVFYGPKIDLKIKDALGREWQLSTIQFDFNMPQRFGMTYVGPDGNEHQPYMVHRALLGSIERFFGVIIEHFGGSFPTWLSPVQAKILTVGPQQVEYGKKVEKMLKSLNLRVDMDERDETLGKKVRDGRLQRIPYLLTVGAKEAENNTVTIRNRDTGNQATMDAQDFANALLTEKASKRLKLEVDAIGDNS